MLKSFFTKKLLHSQLKDLPKDQREHMTAMIEKNPELFMKIAKETKAEMKAGKNQIQASMIVMKRHQKELQQLMGPQHRMRP